MDLGQAVMDNLRVDVERFTPYFSDGEEPAEKRIYRMREGNYRREIAIGSLPNNDVWLNDDKTAPQHARIYWSDGLSVEDIGEEVFRGTLYQHGDNTGFLGHRSGVYDRFLLGESMVEQCLAFLGVKDGEKVNIPLINLLIGSRVRIKGQRTPSYRVTVSLESREPWAGNPNFIPQHEWSGSANEYQLSEQVRDAYIAEHIIGNLTGGLGDSTKMSKGRKAIQTAIMLRGFDSHVLELLANSKWKFDSVAGRLTSHFVEDGQIGLTDLLKGLYKELNLPTPEFPPEQGSIPGRTAAYPVVFAENADTGIQPTLKSIPPPPTEAETAEWKKP